MLWLHVDFDSVCEVVLLAGDEAVDILAGADVAGEAVGVADAAPRFETDERTALLVWCPDAVGLRLRTSDTKHWSTILIT